MLLCLKRTHEINKEFRRSASFAFSSSPDGFELSFVSSSLSCRLTGWHRLMPSWKKGTCATRMNGVPLVCVGNYCLHVFAQRSNRHMATRIYLETINWNLGHFGPSLRFWNNQRPDKSSQHFITQVGFSFWTLGPHQIFCGDCKGEKWKGFFHEKRHGQGVKDLIFRLFIWWFQCGLCFFFVFGLHVTDPFTVILNYTGPPFYPPFCHG